MKESHRKETLSEVFSILKLLLNCGMCLNIEMERKECNLKVTNLQDMSSKSMSILNKTPQSMVLQGIQQSTV